MRTLIAAVAVLTCSVWQGIRTCSGPDGYVSHESTRMGVTTGEDSDGDRWHRAVGWVSRRPRW
jgi:hypothetical protein